MSPYRVVIVDDHPPLREGIAAIVTRGGQFTVAGTAGSGADAMELIRRTTPEIAIVDLTLPDGNGVDLVRQIRHESPDTRILVLTMHARIQMAEVAFSAGADGYLLKESSGDLLLAALGKLTGGAQFLDPKLVSAGTRPGCDDAAEPVEAVQSLSPREREVFERLAIGRSAKEIAAELNISAKTVDNHRAHIMERLCISTTAELVRLAIRAGVIDP